MITPLNERHRLICRTFFKLLDASEAFCIGAEILAVLLGIRQARLPQFKTGPDDIPAFAILCPGASHRTLRRYLIQNEGYSVFSTYGGSNLGGVCELCPIPPLANNTYSVTVTWLKNTKGSILQLRSAHDDGLGTSHPVTNDLLSPIHVSDLCINYKQRELNP
jgi:hypothetical protein